MFRGDVGSWVREAAMLALPQTLTLLRRLDPEGLKVSEEEQAHLTQQLIRALLKQAVERIARLREVSLVSLGLLCKRYCIWLWRCCLHSTYTSCCQDLLLEAEKM